MTRKTKQPVNTLEQLFLSLSDNSKQRARLMAKICADADVGYSHLKGVMNRKRSLSIDSATRFIEEAKKRGYEVSLLDLTIPQSARK